VKVVYIAFPCGTATPEETEKDKRAAHAACEEAYRLGRLNGIKIIPVTPVGNFPYLDGGKPDERDRALRMGIALLSKCDELWAAGDRVSEGMRDEMRAAVRMGKPVYSMGIDRAKIQEAIADMSPMLDEKNCLNESAEKNYKGRLLVLKASALAPWAAEPENQLWIASDIGFGTDPNALGRAVYAKNLCDGEEARWNRGDFHGIADPAGLPDWARTRFDEYRQQQTVNESEEFEP
jgi:hypothetical protein